MKLIPATIRNLQALSWQGATTGLEYQRLTLRLCLAILQAVLIYSAVFGLPLLLVVALINIHPPFGQLLPQGLGKLYYAVVMALTLAFGLWYLIINLKLAVLRIRGLGFSTRAVVAILLGALAGSIFLGMVSYVRENPLLIYLYLPLWLAYALPVLATFSIFGGLISYWMNFETTPIGRTQTKPAKPFAAAPQRFENAALFLLQTWLWYSILSTPLHVIFNY